MLESSPCDCVCWENQCISRQPGRGCWKIAQPADDASVDDDHVDIEMLTVEPSGSSRRTVQFPVLQFGTLSIAVGVAALSSGRASKTRSVWRSEVSLLVTGMIGIS